jgi:hypothetical protein
MLNFPHVLDLIIVIAAFSITIQAYRQAIISKRNNPPGHREPLFKFDRSRLKLCILPSLLIVVLAFGVGILETKNVGMAAEFCVIASFLGVINCIAAIAYVRK